MSVSTPIHRFDAIVGTPDDDQLNGANGVADSIDGVGGDDAIQGLSGDDVLRGGAGDDKLYGGSGADTLDGGTGTNTLEGGSGNDLFILTNVRQMLSVFGGSGIDTVDFSTAKAGVRLDLASVNNPSLGVEHVVGSAFDDSLSGKSGDSTLEGGDGNDVIASFHQLNAKGHLGDVLDGGAGDDTLLAGAGETLVGGEGADYFSAFGSGNTLSGGEGADTFYFRYLGLNKLGDNLIVDLGSDDVIDISDVETKGGQPFTRVDHLDGNGVEAALVYDPDSDRTSLLLDTDGNGVANITILISGDHHDFTNFVL